MNARDLLIVEAVQAARHVGSAAARACAARVAKEADTAELAKAPEFQAHALFALRSALLALGTAPEEPRVFLGIAIDTLVKALRVRPSTAPRRSVARMSDQRLYWVDR